MASGAGETRGDGPSLRGTVREGLTEYGHHRRTEAEGRQHRELNTAEEQSTRVSRSPAWVARQRRGGIRAGCAHQRGHAWILPALATLGQKPADWGPGKAAHRAGPGAPLWF